MPIWSELTRKFLFCIRSKFSRSCSSFIIRKTSCFTAARNDNRRTENELELYSRTRLPYVDSKITAAFSPLRQSAPVVPLLVYWRPIMHVDDVLLCGPILLPHLLLGRLSNLNFWLAKHQILIIYCLVFTIARQMRQLK